MLDSFQLIKVFSKPRKAEGSYAAILIENAKSTLQKKSVISLSIKKNHSIETTCFILRISQGKYEVICFNGEKRVQCCGHGLIAAAKTILTESELPLITMNETVTALSKTDRVENDVIELSLPRMYANKISVPEWVTDLMFFEDNNLQVNDAATSKKQDGYLLLEFEPSISLDAFRHFKLDVERVCKQTQRALIIVKFDFESKQLYTRYFAPQYGVMEDIATGSVMRFVGDYIEKKYQIFHFDVTQCSSQGGFMTIDCKENYIVITAKVIMEDVT